MFVLLLASVGAIGPVIVPQPNDMKIGKGNWKLESNAEIGYDATISDSEDVANQAAEQLRLCTGFSLPVVGKRVSSGIYFGKSESAGKEEYHLTMTSSLVSIVGSTHIGLFYGLQSLLQLMPPEVLSNHTVTIDWIAPIVTIHDKPRFAWRGLMVDVSRHFQTMESMRNFVTSMIRYKMNILHWHITDDTGWRLESKVLPGLHINGSHGQYYTQEEVKSFIKWAHRWGVTVVPEFEMPGHAGGTLAGFPQYTCNGHGGPFCPGNDEALEFVKTYLTEFLEIFDSPYIHVGGDECPEGAWRKCPKCQARMKEKGLNSTHELYHWFMNYFSVWLRSKGRIMLGWDDILDDGLSKGDGIMVWHYGRWPERCTSKGYHVVQCPMARAYFDYHQFPAKDNYSYAWGFIPLHKAYDWDPVEGVDKQYWDLIIGCQGNIWAEQVFDHKNLEWKGFIRGAAMAEVGWTDQDKRDWGRFFSGLTLVEYHRMKLRGVNAAPCAWGPDVGWASGGIPTSWIHMKWDVTGAFDDRKDGYGVIFVYEKGKNGLKIKNVELKIGGVSEGIDTHEGLAFDPPKDNIWTFDVKHVAGNQQILVEADVSCDGGVDSEGRIYVYHH
jgi:hexosaminidase